MIMSDTDKNVYNIYWTHCLVKAIRAVRLVAPDKG
jgi:hypothetical protein